jgi:hypothetical protein
MACRRRINGATRSGLRLVMQRLIPKPSLGLFFAARGISGTTNNSDKCCREATLLPNRAACWGLSCAVSQHAAAPSCCGLSVMNRLLRPGWVYCEKCLHHAPKALVPLIIRWGADTSSDRLRERARCTKCGHRGATLQHPGWAGTHIGFQPFPKPVESSSQS